MIEQVRGKLLKKTPTFCVVDCHGIGIGLHVSLNTFQYLEHKNNSEDVQLFTYLHVREDAMQLFGFAELDEKELFELLITISGVGPKLAVAILSGGSTEDLRTAIASSNVSMLTRIPGVGKKTAQRLVLELKEKIDRKSAGDALAGLAVNDGAASHIQEAILGLTSLGYKELAAQQAVQAAAIKHGKDLTLEQLIKLALKEL